MGTKLMETHFNNLKLCLYPNQDKVNHYGNIHS